MLKGRLYSLRKDGTKDSLYLNIRNRRFLFGSSEYCTVRIYIDGISPEHCVLSIGDQGKAYLESLHPSATTLVNGIKINHKVCLEDNDVVTIFKKEFQFVYPSNTLSRNDPIRSLILPFPKQVKPAHKFKLLTLEKNWEASCLSRETSASNINCISEKQIYIVESNILKKIPGYLLKIMLQKSAYILCEKMHAQEIDSCFDKSLIKDKNQYFKESPEERRNLVLKLYGFINFLREMLKRNEYLYDLWLILKSVWKFCIARAGADILFLPLKSLNLKGEIITYKKSLQSRIASYTSENLSPVFNTVSENSAFDVSASSNCKTDGQTQIKFSSRKISISYKKRVSLAVKRYHLRKRKSIMMAKADQIESIENLELSGLRQELKDYIEINSGEQNVLLNLDEQKFIRTKRKRCYNKKDKEELQDERNLKKEPEINIELVKDPTGKINTVEQPKEKQRNKKASVKKTDLKIGKENIAEVIDNSSRNQASISNLKEQKVSKRKQNSKYKGLKQESEKESIEYSAGEQNTNTKFTETKATKRSYKRKKKEALTNNTALKDETETKLVHDSPMKQNNVPESKKRNYKKKKEVFLEKTDSYMINNSDGKSIEDCDTQELTRCQRVTRSMVKKRF